MTARAPRFVVAMAVLALARYVGAAETQLSLMLEPVKKTYRMGESVDVRVMLAGPPEGVSWVVIPRIIPEDSALGTWPLLRLAFEVRDERGQAVSRLPWKSTDKVAVPDASQFAELHGGELVGRTVSLTQGPWAHRIVGPGRYRVMAVLHSRAREWLEAGIRSRDVDEDELSFSLERVLQGTLRSDKVEIQIVKAP